jgi:hypothetical protein
MAIAAFDTLKFANTLKAAGVPDKQAEAQAVAFGEAFQVNLKELATKEDLRHEMKEMEQRLNAHIDSVASDLKSSRSELKGDIQLLKWMAGAAITIGIAILVRLFFFHAPF